MIESKFPFRGRGYDFIFAGAGCAALSLLMRMIRSGKFNDKKILLIDKAPKTKNDRTWCFWEKQDGFFEDIVYKKWGKLSFFGDDYSNTMDISPYQYKMIRGIDFYTYCFDEIAKNKNIEIIYGTISSIICDRDGISIDIDDRSHFFDHAILFNSFPKAGKPYSMNLKDEIKLLQHFKGWIIETTNEAFDPGQATFMDFRVQQDRGTTFAYVLPFSTNRALVEYTLFTENILEDEEYEKELAVYIKKFLGIDDYKIVEKEFGIIPMTTRRFQFFTGYIYYIGTAGGQTKPSSGYTFQFIQKHSDLIVEYLLLPGKSLSQMPGMHHRFFFYDRVFLDVLSKERATGKSIFTALFKKNKPQQVLKFLDNETSLTEEIKLISTLQTIPFLKAAFQQFLVNNS